MTVTTHTLSIHGLNHHVVDTAPEGSAKGTVICLHGFPDDHHAWDALTPLLIANGYRVIAPDLRGFGKTDMAGEVKAYDMFTGAMPDVIAILDRLGVTQAHLVGHDFGAALSWLLAAQHGDRFKTLTAMGVGHQRAFLKVRFDSIQRRKSRYIAYHQLRGFCEWAYRRGDWAWFRRHWASHYDLDGVIKQMAHPGRLTAGLNWYRANISLSRMLMAPRVGAFGEEIVRIPTLGLLGQNDRYLGEAQMAGSNAYIDAPWRYECLPGLGHWVQTEAPERVAEMLLGFWEEKLSAE